MKVLVSTTQTQSQFKSDFCHVPEGEHVIYPPISDNGCSMMGLCCSRHTTTFKVIDLPITQEALIEEIYEWNKRFIAGFKTSPSKKRLRELRAQAITSAKNLCAEISQFPIGTTLERVNKELRVRT